MEVFDIIKAFLSPLNYHHLYHSQWSNGARKLTIVHDSQTRAEEYSASGQSMKVSTKVECLTQKLSD